jgi:hypothetical protein
MRSFACSFQGSVQPLEGILVMVHSPEACLEANGDLRPGDNCGRLTVIETEGLVRIGSQGTTKELGTVPSELLDALEAAIGSTDFTALRVAPWEGECPEDGFGWQLVRYEFFVAGGQQRLSACGTEIDPDHPLFVALGDALGSVGEPLPTP